MSNFSRALRLALRNRWNVVFCFATSICVAVLWAGNLAGVLPIVDAVMRDMSIPEWVAQSIASDREKISELESSLALLDADSDDPKVQQKVAGVEYSLGAYRRRLSWQEWIKPSVDRWLPKTPFATLVYVCVFMIVMTLVRNAFRVANLVLMNRIGFVTMLTLRNEYYRQVLRLELAAFTERGRGDLMNRCTTDLSAVGVAVQQVFGPIIREPLKMAACFVVAACISWRLLLLTTIVAPLAFVVIRWLAKAIKRANRRALEELSTIFDTLTETLSTIQLIKGYTMESPERARFNKSAKILYRRQMKIAGYGSLLSPITEILGVAMVLLAAMAGGYLVLKGQTHLFGYIRISDTPLSHGQMSVFFAMLAGMSDPARRMSAVINVLQRGAASADRVYEILDREPAIVDPPKPKPMPERATPIAFEGVHFRYEPQKAVLSGVDLEVARGETIAIIGPNGCGKSTLLSLLPRFYDVTAGRLTMGGVDVRDVSLRDLRSRIGVVSQQVQLMNGTVAENIAYGSPDATQEQIEQAATKSHAHGFITEKLVDGYDCVVGPGGARLSGGQRQRIALARVILRNPEVLILDEATSQVDVESERLIHEVLQDFTRTRTTLIITHRPSTLSLADRVVVMNKGAIEDIGTPDELLDRCDLFRRLCHVGYRRSA